LNPIHPLIEGRRSGRLIDPDRIVADKIIYSLIEAARWAPSCYNNQPWRFVVCRDQALVRVKSCLSKGNAWALNAPLIIAIVSTPELGCRSKGRDYYCLDMGLAIENCLLQGIDFGLVMHPIAGFDEEELKLMLKIPDKYRVFALIIVGYPETTNSKDGNSTDTEERTSRKPLKEILFWEGWKSESANKS